jgi:ubiquinol-cytochrome c reductase cytochrome c1 subunit
MTKRLISTILLSFGLLLGSASAWAEGPELPSAGNNLRDQASLQRGAHLFFNYCVGCHSLKYMRYSRIAQDLNLSEKDLNFTGANLGDPVAMRMSDGVAEMAFGKVPPDLSLEVGAKGTDWVYAYLDSFYLDPKTRTGWNNVLFPNVAMPFPLSALQGEQRAVMKPGTDDVEKLELAHPGTMTPVQYQQAMRDLVNFLDYASEPAVMQRRRYGLWVILFLALFTFLAWLLKKEYWKDVD